MLKLVEYIFTIQALINVGTISPPVLENNFDKIVNFFTYVFSSLYLFIRVNDFISTNESNIINLLFIDNYDYLLFKVFVTIGSNLINLQEGNKGITKVFGNLILYSMYENKIKYFSLMFSDAIFTHIVLPWIKIAYNYIFLGKQMYHLTEQKKKMTDGLTWLSAIYLLMVIIMTRKHGFV